MSKTSDLPFESSSTELETIRQSIVDVANTHLFDTSGFHTYHQLVDEIVELIEATIDYVEDDTRIKLNKRADEFFQKNCDGRSVDWDDLHQSGSVWDNYHHLIEYAASVIAQNLVVFEGSRNIENGDAPSGGDER